MWEEIIGLAVGNGLWAVLTCALLAFVLKDSKRREIKYTDIIQSLSDKLKTVADIKSDTEMLITMQSRSTGAKKQDKKPPVAEAEVAGAPA